MKTKRITSSTSCGLPAKKIMLSANKIGVFRTRPNIHHEHDGDFYESNKKFCEKFFVRVVNTPQQKSGYENVCVCFHQNQQ